MNQRLIHDAAFTLATDLAAMLNIRDEEVADAVHEFYPVCKAGIERYEEQANRMQQRLHPLPN